MGESSPAAFETPNSTNNPQRPQQSFVVSECCRLHTRDFTFMSMGRDWLVFAAMASVALT